MRMRPPLPAAQTALAKQFLCRETLERDEGHMFKSIIWATDGSEDAAKALPLTKELAQQGDAAITVVHVLEHFEGAGAVGHHSVPTRPMSKRSSSA
jgi:hypothetical protein